MSHLTTCRAGCTPLIIYRISIVFCISIFLLVIQTSPSSAEDKNYKFGLGLGYPYFSLKYNLSRRFAVDGRGAFGDGINAFGGRGYFNFYRIKKSVFFTGVEGDYITFNVDGAKGNGTLWMPFIGGEQFIFSRMTLALDFGAAYLDIKDSEIIGGNQVSASGFEWTINVGLNFYFGVSKSSEKSNK